MKFIQKGNGGQHEKIRLYTFSTNNAVKYNNLSVEDKCIDRYIKRTSRDT